MKLAIFIPDDADFSNAAPVGSGEVVYIHYRVRRGPFLSRRLRRRFGEVLRGAYTFDRYFAERLSLPVPTGDAARLVHAVWDRLLPEGVVQLSLAPGEGFLFDTVLRAARRVQFLELLGDAALSPLADAIEAETGLVVPIVSAPHEGEGALSVFLPGAVGGTGLDLTCPETTVGVLPPPALRKIAALVGTSLETLAALLPFFGFSYADADVFCKNS